MKTKFTLLALAALLFAGCEKDDNGSVKETLSLDDPSVSIHYDESYQFALSHEPNKQWPGNRKYMNN